MKIDLEHKGSATIMRLDGRLDATWAPHVMARAQDVLRGGRHCLLLDASDLAYLSSAGIRILLQLRREVAAVKGQYFVIHPSEFVGQALRMSGLDMLIATNEQVAELTAAAGDPAQSAEGSFTVDWVDGMAMESYPLESGGGMVVRMPAQWTPWTSVRDEDVRPVALPEGTVAFGIGAAGRDMEDVRGRFGEFIAAAGCLAWQPTDARQLMPDFVTQEGIFVPEIRAIQALVAEGRFSSLLRFQPAGETGSLALGDLAECVLRSARAEAAVFVALAETDGLVGLALARSPGRIEAHEQPGSFPDIRDWMNYCGERVHAGRTALAVGIVGRNPQRGAWTHLLTPLPSKPQLSIHAHAAAFPFRPLPGGTIAMESAVRAFFEAREPLDLLHLTEDTRPLTGLGQSSFIRGACWCAPVRHEAQGGAT